MGGLLSGVGVGAGGGAKGMLAPLQNYWGGGGLAAPGFPSSYAYVVHILPPVADNCPS